MEDRFGGVGILECKAEIDECEAHQKMTSSEAANSMSTAGSSRSNSVTRGSLSGESVVRANTARTEGSQLKGKLERPHRGVPRQSE